MVVSIERWCLFAISMRNRRGNPGVLVCMIR